MPGVGDVAPGVVDPVPLCGVEVIPGLAAAPAEPDPVEPAPAPVCGAISAAISYLPAMEAVGPGFPVLLLPQWSAILVTLLTWNELVAVVCAFPAPGPVLMLPALPVCALVDPDVLEADALESPIDELLEEVEVGEVPPLPSACPVTSTC
jgi:hypothetical protein